MTKLDTYKCDRCGKEFKIDSDKIPPTILKFEERYTQLRSDETKEFELHLCIDCESGFCYWLRYQEEHDKLSNKLALKETGEE